MLQIDTRTEQPEESMVAVLALQELGVEIGDESSMPLISTASSACN